MKRTIAIVACVAVVLGTAQAEPRHYRYHDNKNYILRRQQAYQVQGVPTSRLIIGTRQIDIYPNGLMFEGDNLVGIKRP